MKHQDTNTNTSNGTTSNDADEVTPDPTHACTELVLGLRACHELRRALEELVHYAPDSGATDSVMEPLRTAERAFVAAFGYVHGAPSARIDDMEGQLNNWVCDSLLGNRPETEGERKCAQCRKQLAAAGLEGLCAECQTRHDGSKPSEVAP